MEGYSEAMANSEAEDVATWANGFTCALDEVVYNCSKLRRQRSLDVDADAMDAGRDAFSETGDDEWDWQGDRNRSPAWLNDSGNLSGSGKWSDSTSFKRSSSRSCLAGCDGAMDSTWKSLTQERRMDGRVRKVEALHGCYLSLSLGQADGDVSCGDTYGHRESACRVAAAMVEAVGAVQRPDGAATRLRVGLCTGPVCCAVVGDDRPRFRQEGF